jgi:hypothetical protein
MGYSYFGINKKASAYERWQQKGWRRSFLSFNDLSSKDLTAISSSFPVARTLDVPLFSKPVSFYTSDNEMKRKVIQQNVAELMLRFSDRWRSESRP